MRPLVVLASLSLLAFGLAPAPARAQATVPIELGSFYFCSPSFNGGVCETTVVAGDTVVWTNVTGAHTVTECDASFTTCPPAGGFDSGTSEPLGPGDRFQHTFTTPGVFPYLCLFHPTAMRGQITVLAAATATPTPAPAAASTPTAGAASPSPGASPAPRAANVPSAGGSPAGDAFPWEWLLGGGTLLLLGGAFALARGYRR